MLDISNQTVAQWPAAQDITGIRTSLGFIYIIISRFKKPTKINQFFSHSLVINTEQMADIQKFTCKSIEHKIITTEKLQCMQNILLSVAALKEQFEAVLIEA
jgi:hypothetical protein